MRQRGEYNSYKGRKPCWFFSDFISKNRHSSFPPNHSPFCIWEWEIPAVFTILIEIKEKYWEVLRTGCYVTQNLKSCYLVFIWEIIRLAFGRFNSSSLTLFFFPFYVSNLGLCRVFRNDQMSSWWVTERQLLLHIHEFHIHRFNQQQIELFTQHLYCIRFISNLEMIYGRMCIGYMQIQCHLYKGFEHWLILVSARGTGTNPLQTEEWLYCFTCSIFQFVECNLNTRRERVTSSGERWWEIW